MKDLAIMAFVSILLIVAIDGVAHEPARIGAQQFPIEWQKYLSDADREDIALQIAIADFKERAANGTLWDNVEGETTVTIPMSIVPISEAAKSKAAKSQSGGAVTSQVSAGDGYITCNINTQNPHPRSGPNGTTTKAKSKGPCNYFPNPGHPIPSSIEYRLIQILFKTDLPSMNGVAVWPEIGLNVSWESYNTQVYMPSCVSGEWAHTDLMYVIPPPGWGVIGQNPWTVGGPTIAYVNCP